MSEQPIKLFISAADFEKWMETEHNQSNGIWLQIAKKDSGKSSVSYPEALDIALCFGWIDGQKKKLDEQYFLQRFTPRLSARADHPFDARPLDQPWADGIDANIGVP